MSLKTDILPKIDTVQHDLGLIRKLLESRGDYAKLGERIDSMEADIHRLAERCADADDGPIAELRGRVEALEKRMSSMRERVLPSIERIADDGHEMRARLAELSSGLTQRVAAIEERIADDGPTILRRRVEALEPVWGKLGELMDRFVALEQQVADVDALMSDSGYPDLSRRIAALEKYAPPNVPPPPPEIDPSRLTDEENAELNRLRAADHWNVLSDASKKRLAELEAKLAVEHPETCSSTAPSPEADTNYSPPKERLVRTSQTSGTLEMRYAPKQAQEPGTRSATSQYATAQDIERLGVDLREQLTHMHADLGKALAAAHVGGGETLLAVESTVRNGFERIVRMLHDVMLRLPLEKKEKKE